MRRIGLILGLCCIVGIVRADWNYYFAYNNVTQIAMTETDVYALSSGMLFSVNKVTEKIKTYSSEDGLHSTGISQLAYDEVSKKVLIVYNTGKMDLITSDGIE